MKKSRVLTLGLACFFTAVTAFSTLTATTGGGRFLANLNDKSSISNPLSQGGVCSPQNGANSAQNGANLTPQEQLLAGTGLALDPENDPVVYTTDYGLEIKYANALTNTNLAGYTYFTMGEYNGTPINWVIIGYDPSMADFVGDFSGGTGVNADPVQGENNQFSTLDNTPAGLAIKKEMFAISSQAVENDEIGDGCVLCLSEHVIFDAQFHNSTAINGNYELSDLKDTMQSLFDEDLNFNEGEKNNIVIQTFSNLYYGSQYSETKDVYLFPLAAYGEKFDVWGYLTTPESRQCIGSTDWQYWWLRSCFPTHYSGAAVIQTGTGNLSHVNVAQLGGVRPAFVLQL